MLNFLMLVIGFVLVMNIMKSNVALGLLALVLLVLYYLYSNYSSICFMVAMKKYSNGNKDEAFDWFHKAYKHKTTLNQKVTYAYYLLREGRTEKAESIYNSLLAMSGLRLNDRCQIKSNQAILYIKTERVDDAIEMLEEILPNFKNTNIYGTLGFAYIVKGDLEKAEEFCLEAFDYNADNAIILDNLVQLYLKKEDYENAYKYAEMLKEKAPSFVEGNYDVGVAYAKVGKIDEAKEALNKALSIESSFLSNVSHDKVREFLDTL